MYQTEGYVDQDTYFAKEYVWSHVIRYRGQLCFCWWVCEKAAEPELCNRIRCWIQQELTEALGRGNSAMKKELQRFGALLKRESLFLYYQGKLWQYDRERGLVLVNRWSIVLGKVGLFVSESLGQLEEVQLLEEELRGNEKEGHKVFHSEQGGLNGLGCLAQLANYLQAISLRAMSEGKLQQGYFLLWEAVDVV